MTWWMMLQTRPASFADVLWRSENEMRGITRYSGRNILENQHQIRDEALDARALQNNNLYLQKPTMWRNRKFWVGFSKNDSLWPETCKC